MENKNNEKLEASSPVDTITVKARCSYCGYVDNEPIKPDTLAEVRKCSNCLEEVDFENILDG
jgi:hypothetical protein